MVVLQKFFGLLLPQEKLGKLYQLKSQIKNTLKTNYLLGYDFL